MKGRVVPSEPTCRCVTCGRRITGEDYPGLWDRYNEHVRTDHDYPDTIYDT